MRTHSSAPFTLLASLAAVCSRPPQHAPVLTSSCYDDILSSPHPPQVHPNLPTFASRASKLAPPPSAQPPPQPPPFQQSNSLVGAMHAMHAVSVLGCCSRPPQRIPALTSSSYRSKSSCSDSTAAGHLIGGGAPPLLQLLQQLLPLLWRARRPADAPDGCCSGGSHRKGVQVLARFYLDHQLQPSGFQTQQHDTCPRCSQFKSPRSPQPPLCNGALGQLQTRQLQPCDTPS